MKRPSSQGRRSICNIFLPRKRWLKRCDEVGIMNRDVLELFEILELVLGTVRSPG